VRSLSLDSEALSFMHTISPGFLDIQINGAYGFDFSVYQGNDEAYLTGLKSVTEKIVETGVTSYARSSLPPSMRCLSMLPNRLVPTIIVCS
jgi:N-acetylglucosamine-6-phosphate deacetylase